MSEREKPQICVDVAGEIKGLVKEALEKNGRVSPILAKVLRKIAREDADHHIKYDPSFLCGGGLAEREKSSD
ncbi:hypothetical protein KAT60_02615 [Candidatus Woesebacteria bacterium]|nr:hypothetical protein [Candidatus Woesebacteria bacterium]